MKGMKIRIDYSIILLLFFCISAGAVISAQDQIFVKESQEIQLTGEEGNSSLFMAPGTQEEWHEVTDELNAIDGDRADRNQSVAYAGMVPGSLGYAASMQTTGSAPFWLSVWFYILLTVVAGSILIYLYIEHDRKVISVQKEVERLKEENEALKEELTQRMSELEAVVKKLKRAEAELEGKSHESEMAEIATGVLQNVANVLSSLNSSNTFIKDTAKNSKLEGLLKANKILREHIDHIDQFIYENPKGKKLLEYYLKLEEPLKKERDDIVSQSERLDEKINIINDVITAQQSHAGISNQLTSELSLSGIVESTLSLHSELIDDYNLSIKQNLKATIPVIAQRSKLIHVLVNFIKNAGESMENNRDGNKNLTIKSWEDSHRVYLSITDNGAGIENKNLDKVFSHKYSTKKKGHGFGLHSSANYMKEVGGNIKVSSEGVGKGTTFTLIFPILREKEYSRSLEV